MMEMMHVLGRGEEVSFVSWIAKCVMGSCKTYRIPKLNKATNPAFFFHRIFSRKTCGNGKMRTRN